MLKHESTMLISDSGSEMAKSKIVVHFNKLSKLTFCDEQNSVPTYFGKDDNVTEK